MSENQKLTKQRWFVLIAACVINVMIGTGYAWSMFVGNLNAAFGGEAMGTALNAVFDAVPWLMAGLSAAGGMMRFVGFATLLRIMLSNDHWGIYFAGFTMATIIGYIPELAGSALLLIAFVGIALALNDFQTGVALKNAGGNGNGGDDDGI